MRKFFLLLMALGVSLSMMAGDKLSARTQVFLQQRATAATQLFNGKSTLAKGNAVNGVEYIDCFISLNDASTSELEDMGVIVDGIYNGFVTAKVPVDKLEQVAMLSSVKQVGIARNLRLFTDKAMSMTNADKAWDGTNYGLPAAYTGKDVVIGIIDDGIEFNHPAFKDANGNTRVKAVYMPNATTANGGSHPTVGGTTLSGYAYTTASQIANLTTDDTGETHGTHTSGCAGASKIEYSSGKYYSGMAPECDLVLCGCGENLTETAILNSAKYIANYAQSVGKPCVISISLGSDVGPHDGKSSISIGYDQIAQQYGAVILLAAGNEADVTGHATKTLSSSSDAMAVIHTPTDYFTSNGYSSYYGLVGDCDIWNSTSDQLKVKVLVVNSSGAVQYESNAMSSGTISASTLSSYFSTSNSSGISISGGLDANNNRYNLYISAQLGKNQGSYKIVYVVTGSAGNTINAWTEAFYSQLATSGSISGYTRTNGTYAGTMCDDMCGSKVIGVGAYCSRTTFPYNNGSSTGNVSDYYGTTTLNDIANFSSYGVDCNGVQQPFITAPGHTIVSTLNRHSSPSSSDISYRKSYSGTYEYWGWMSGTSMATPVAAGVVALYLQADPTLDVDGVKDVIVNSAITDNYTSSHSAMFGHGKINALGGIEYILNQSSDPTITVTPETVNFEGYIDGTYTETVTVTGRNLTGNISIAKSGSSYYTVSPTTITPAQAEAGATVTITYKPTTTGTTNATLTLSSTGAESKTVAITGVASYEIVDPVATAATDVTFNSFTANWNACPYATSYTLRVMPKPEITTELLLTEGFSKFTAEGTADIGSSLNTYMDNAGWTGSRLYTAAGGIRLGSANGKGTLTSPALDLTGSNGKVSIVFKAKTYGTDTNCNMSITCGSSSTTVTVPSSTEAEYTQVLDCAEAANQKVAFATTANRKRVIITGIEIYSGDITAGAKAAGEMLFQGITDTHYTVTGLEPATTYIYDVKAVYGDKESNWSNQIEVTTLEAQEEGTTLADILTNGVNGTEYLVSNDLAVVDVADYADYAFLTDGEGNWIRIECANSELFSTFVNNQAIKGNTLRGTLSNIELNPVLIVTEAESGDVVPDYSIQFYYLDSSFTPKVNEVIDVVGWFNASEGTLRAYAPGAVQGTSMTLDTSWGAASNTLQDGKKYEIRCAMNIKEAWHTPAGIMPKDYAYDFQNYIGYALRLPDAPTAIGTIDMDAYNTIVNVYNVQGQLIRENVKAGEATLNLPRGIYIVGDKKIVVR